MRPRSLALRLGLLLALLLLAQGVVLVVLGARHAAAHEAETQQRLSRGLAAHIVGRWPELAPAALGSDAERATLLRMLATVNPAVQVYLLDARGRVAHYIGEPGMVRNAQVDLTVVREFLAGAALPLTGTDPMDPPGAGRSRLFSAAMFPPSPGDTGAPGYLYVVLDSPARVRLVAAGAPAQLGLALGGTVITGAVVLMVLGWVAVRRMTRPLRRLARRMEGFDIGLREAPPPMAAAMAARAGATTRGGDEVQQLGTSFDAMAARLASQAAQAAQQTEAHRQEIAGMAHDLRTPLTALHGHLEALAAGHDDEPRRRLVDAALLHSNQVRRLTQQLFELATLRTDAPPLARERFRLDELVSDTVQKYDLGPAPVELAGPAPGPVEIEGDLQLIDRALTNLIDNAVRHAAAPVQVRMDCSPAQVQVVVQDGGPGLPAELLRRLSAGEPVRSVASHAGARTAGPRSGLGLAIAQRIAELHGGRLEPLPAPAGGTRLSLSLPRV